MGRADSGSFAGARRDVKSTRAPPHARGTTPGLADAAPPGFFARVRAHPWTKAKCGAPCGTCSMRQSYHSIFRPIVCAKAMLEQGESLTYRPGQIVLDEPELGHSGSRVVANNQMILLYLDIRIWLMRYRVGRRLRPIFIGTRLSRGFQTTIRNHLVVTIHKQKSQGYVKRFVSRHLIPPSLKFGASNSLSNSQNCGPSTFSS